MLPAFSSGYSQPLNVADYHSKLNAYVIMVAIIAASGGLLFGYDLGVTGGVESMPSFLEKFFPDIAAQEASTTNTNPYCTFNSHTLQLFTSSLFLAGLVITIPAAYITRKFGRKLTMVISGLWFLLGAGLNAGAQDLAMLIVGRICLGFGIGGANVVVPLYLSEQAPYQWRGALGQLFQLLTTLGILIAQLVNYGVQNWSEGWRLSLGLAGVPALILFIGGLVLPESPNSLIERGYDEAGRRVLEKLRGCKEIDAEFEDIKAAVEQAKSVTAIQSVKAQFTKPYLPMFIVTISIAFFQQLTGINAIMFYVPILFASLGSGTNAALLNTVIIGVINVLATFVAIFTVDKLGRRKLLVAGGIQMFLAMIVTGVVLGVEFGKYNTTDLPSSVAIGVLVVICVFVAGFAWSWGPLGWLVPSEIQTLETRAAGMGSAVLTNFLFSFLIGQLFLSMLCGMKWGVFLFFAGFVFLATCFVLWLVPETKGVPIESVQRRFAKHKVWRKVMGKEVAQEIIARSATNVTAAKVEAGKMGVEATADVADDVATTKTQ